MDNRPITWKRITNQSIRVEESKSAKMILAVEYYRNELRIMELGEQIAGLNGEERVAATNRRNGRIARRQDIGNRRVAAGVDYRAHKAEFRRLVQRFNYGTPAVLSCSRGVVALAEMRRRAIAPVVIHYRVSTSARGETLDEIRRAGVRCDIPIQNPGVLTQIIVE